MADMNNLRQNRPRLFVPSVIRGVLDDTAGASSLTQEDSSLFATTALGNSGSFRYDPQDSGIKSTQQLNVDWSNFANHTFFNSAQVKVNAAFDKIIDRFPFDGTQSEYELFFDGLTGFEKYIYDQFPKNKGYLFLSGTTGAEASGGTYVTTLDLAGAAYPNITRTPNGSAILNPVSKSMTFELQLFLPPVSNSNQYVFNKIAEPTAGTFHGFGLGVTVTGSLTDAPVRFFVVSGSSEITADFTIKKNQFNHVAIIWDRTPGASRGTVYVNQQLVASSTQVEIGALLFDSAPFYVATGSSATGIFAPTNTLSGAVDELRVWHTIRSAGDRAESQRKNVYAGPDLKLYYKFNEPSGSATNLVLDHSGNGLHGQLSATGLLLGVRNIATASIAGSSSMTYERLNSNPVLFPDYPAIEPLRQLFLVSGSRYDDDNPNLILKLVPRHYFLEGRVQDGLTSEEGDILQTMTSGSEPGTMVLGSTQVLLMMLYTWATFFDEIKLHLDSFSNLVHVDYLSDDTIADQFLQFLAKRHGITLPPLFVGTSISQFINAENIDSSISTADYSLQYLQNQIWRRILINLRDIMASKGTIYSVKSFIRTLGIDPDNNFRIREYGGPTRRSLKSSREQRSEIAAVLNFVSGGIARSGFLSGSRVEPGYPGIQGSFVPSSNNTEDGLYTSGSWTYEGTYSLRGTASLSQSLVRLMATGSFYNPVFANLHAVSGSGLVLYVRANDNILAPQLTLVLTGSDFDPMDGGLWNFSFGRQRADSINSVSSSWFLRAAAQSFGDITHEFVTSSFFDDNAIGDFDNNLWSNLTTNSRSGSFLVIGSQSIETKFTFLNSSTAGRLTAFDGKVGQIRFWSKALELVEWEEHVRNFKSLGVQHPKTNFNFETKQSGSFERLRVDVSMDQTDRITNASGAIALFDFSQNNLHLSGTNFPVTSSVVIPQRFYYSMISPHFDEASTTNKVRVRSFLNFDNVLNQEEHYAAAAPVYVIEPSEEPQDSTKFSIDFSIVDALNQDIINIFSTLDDLDGTLGNPENMFSPDYPGLENLRNIYFNRLTNKLNLKSFFEFFKWFDNNIGTFIHQLVPRKTSYQGTNFVIESHMLERHKLEYLFSDIYLGDSVRHAQKDTLLLQLFVASFRKY